MVTELMWPAIFIVVAGLFITIYFKITDRLLKLEIDMATVGTQISPLWAQVQAKIASELHHPNPNYAAMDRLLEKLEALTITGDERIALKLLLLKRSRDMSPEVSEDERKSAILMIQVMGKVLIEAASIQDKIVRSVASVMFWAAGASVTLTNALRNWK